jgi:hypothetical protein
MARVVRHSGLDLNRLGLVGVDAAVDGRTNTASMAGLQLMRPSCNKCLLL